MPLRPGLTAAFMLLTRLPVTRFAPLGEAPELAKCVWAFPAVGLVTGLVAGLAYGLAARLGVPPLLASIWSLGSALLITGGFHEDGLADTADGFGGGGTKARKLEIMRDSRIGSYGALALMLSCAVRIAALTALGQPAAVITALVVAGITGRSAMVLLLILLPSARPDGLGASLGRPPLTIALTALGIACITPFVCLPPGAAAVIVAAGGCAAWTVARIAAAHIDGYTGDVLGAAEVTVECVVLTALASGAMA